MTYAFVSEGTVTEPVTVPSSARRLDTEQWVLGLPGAPSDVQEACGYYQVDETTPTVATPTHVPVRTVALVAGRPAEQWSLRARTTAELEQQTRDDNMTALVAKGRQAFTGNQTFLGIGSPTAAQVRDQVQLLTREMNGTLKLLLARFGQIDVLDDTTGT
jgi:hypothetical protein